MIKYVKSCKALVSLHSVNVSDIILPPFMTMLLPPFDCIIFSDEVPDNTKCMVCKDVISKDEQSLMFSSCSECENHVKDCQKCEQYGKSIQIKHDRKRFLEYIGMHVICRSSGCDCCKKFMLNHKILLCPKCCSHIHLGCSENSNPGNCVVCEKNESKKIATWCILN